ncbi:MAG: insulinase family protein, partial [Candidatus Aminicenantes bacterium]|nr:insulinase family protein [Candidatus Aminicenantes bacterium]
QAYVIIGLAAPPFNHEDYFSMDLLNYILGQGVNPLIQLALRGRIKLAEGAFTRYIPLKYGGAFLVYVITEPGHIKTVERAIVRFLKTTRTFRYAKKDFLAENQSSVFDYLESAQNQVGLNAEQAREEGLHEAIAYAKYMLLAAKEKEMKYKNTIETIDSSQLRNTAAKYLSGEKYVVVYLLPNPGVDRGKR